MGILDKYLGKWASRKLLVLIIAIGMSLTGKLNDNLTTIMIFYVVTQGAVDTAKFIENYFKSK